MITSYENDVRNKDIMKKEWKLIKISQFSLYLYLFFFVSFTTEAKCVAKYTESCVYSVSTIMLVQQV